MKGFRFIVLLITLVLLVLGIPLARQALPRGHALSMHVVTTMFLVPMLVAAVFAVSENRRTTVNAILLALLAGVFEILDSVIDHAGLSAVSWLFGIVFLSFVVAVILRGLFVESHVTANMICASLCVYLLLAVIWADVYLLIDVITEGGAFYCAYTPDDLCTTGAMCLRGPDATPPIYFSLVTLTTLGYGDIVPRTALAQAFASIEAVTGQIYLTVLVARLVGLHISHSILRRESSGNKNR